MYFRPFLAAFRLLFSLLFVLCVIKGDQSVCNSDSKDCINGHTSFWTDKPPKHLTVLVECPCNNLTSLELTLNKLHEILSSTVSERTTETNIILFTEYEKTLKYKRTINYNGCGRLCEETTPTDSTILQASLNITIDVLKSERKWVESSPINELHVIGIISGNYDTSHVTDHVTNYPQELYHPLITSLLDWAITRQTALHYLVNPVGVLTLLGDPLQSVTYTDRTHYNKALTLSNLISTDQSDTVQGHCLSAGLHLQVSKYTPSLEALHYSTIKWDPYPLNVQYTDKCVMVDCPHYCSPLHGCIDNTTLTSAVNSHKPLLSSVEFKTSHAEYKTLWNTVNEEKESDYSKLSILKPSDNKLLFTYNDVVKGQPDTIKWSSYEDIITRGRPVLISSTDINKWLAIKKWNMSYLSNHITDTSFVKCSNNYLTFDPDNKAPLKLDLSLPYTIKNMSSDLFFACIEDPTECNDTFKGHYYFGEIPLSLKPDLQPNSFLYNTQEDYDKKRQYMWISSTGMITHGHFDQDYNLFIQLIGKKRFTFWSPSQHELLYPYPRVHPLWHKSRINFRDVDFNRFPHFARSHALQVTVEPGNILYIPPYTWHYVETLSPSVSLSTWSHDYHMYSHMNAVYGHDHKFDLIGGSKGQMFALRLYLDMLIQDLYGFNETSSYFAKLIALRYSGLEHLFPPEKDDHLICDTQKTHRGKIPTCFHVHGFVKFDVQIIGPHFKSLRPEVMDILLSNYVEEISAQVVGVNKVLAFFRYCFQGQNYYITNEGDEEHSVLWDSPKI